MQWEGGFAKYLDSEKHWNFQVKKIAGLEDLDVAKGIITERFFLVGIVEEFIGFLLLLRKKLRNGSFKIFNYHLNKGKKSSTRDRFEENLDQYRSAIIQRNRLDIELYDYVKATWIKEKDQFEPSFSREVENLKQKSWKLNNGRRYLNLLYRNLYFEPLLALHRVASGREIRGGY
jgi:hypothetical protein